MKRGLMFLTLAAISLFGIRVFLPEEAPATTMPPSKIDSTFQAIWKEKGIHPATLSSDEEFVRRIYLDLTGKIPSPVRTRTFIESKDPNKRSHLIDEILKGNDYPKYFASQWTTLFLGHERTRFVDRNAFGAWFTNQFRENVPWNEITTSLLTARGSLLDSPQLNWFAKQKLDAANLADDTARFFLGVQLGCARCHNHPHDDWKLEDFYGLAAFYSGLKRDRNLSFAEKMTYRNAKKAREEMKEQLKTDGNKLRDDPKLRAELRMKAKESMNDVRGIVRIVQENEGEIDTEIQGQSKTYPAKFLMEPSPAHLSTAPLQQLASWITSPQNPYFAKAFVNRTWAMLMGKGFVDPVDDMSKSNQPSIPGLLDSLADDFVKDNYNVKNLIATIANSRVYQLSSQTPQSTEPTLFETGKMQMMNADQLLNSMLVATSVDKVLRAKSKDEYEERKSMVKKYYVFLFDNDDNQGNEEEFQGTIPQALFLMNGKMTNDALRPFASNTTSRVLSDYEDPARRIEELYLGTLSRKPTPQESEKLVAYIRQNGNKDSAYEDILWSLMNSHEFLFNH
jgi:Protein of unknown function (DUF1553)/Protein of unknown function (DUF1549)